jgi:glyoxylase-like metal-dependent hydrolase (beta-lactamase superfamily II)
MTTRSDLFQVVVVRYGCRTTRRSEVYLNYHVYGEPDAPIGMDYFFWVLRGADRTIVVDTGFSAQGGASRGRRTLIAPAAALELLAVDPATVAGVVLTHAHYDHIGNVDLFRRATLTMSRREYEFWSGPLAGREQFRHSVEQRELDLLAAARAAGRLELFAGEHVVAPGVRLVEVGGHTPGQSILVVDTTDGPVIIASDAVHYHEELDRDMPFAQVADLPAMYRGFDLIRSLAGRLGARVLTGHDPATLAACAPLGGPEPLASLAGSIGSAPLAGAVPR